MLSVEYLEKCMYPATLMFPVDRDHTKLLDPGREAQVKKLVAMYQILEQPSEEEQLTLARRLGYHDMTLEDIREEAAKPGPPRREPLTADAIWDLVWKEAQVLKNESDASRRRSAWKLFGPVAMCEVHQRLLERFGELMPELKVMLACSDNHAFVQLAEESGLLPGWSVIYALIGKSRLALDDMLALAEWGKANPDALALLWKTHVMFGILSFSISAPLGFSRMLENGHSAYLLFLYAARPELCPMLGALVPEEPYKQGDALRQSFHDFVPSEVYQWPYLYRAKVFECLLAGNAAEARRMIGLMREHVGFYSHGTPSGFINNTEKMAEQYIKKYLK